jgi:hypothetical protein
VQIFARFAVVRPADNKRVNVNLLIDAIVRQTTVLIAQLATAAGVRAPLAHTANQVFVDLVRVWYPSHQL